MPHSLYLTISFLTMFGFSTPSFAAPPDTGSDIEMLTVKIEEKFSDHKVEVAKSTARLKRKLDKGHAKAEGDISEEIEVMIDVMEDAFSEGGLFRDLAALFSDFAEDIDVETDEGQTVLLFDGTKIGKIQRQKSRDSEDRFSISGLGKSLSFDRETIVKDGKSKTRIVIDMNGEDEIDITLPDLDKDLDQK